MFPSSGLFSNLNCPFSKRGRCERPQCWYKHAAQLRDTACGSPAIGCAGVQNGFPNAGCGAPVNDATRVVCFKQLERINKEIETVRNEVEREQRRLSCYQTVQAESKNTRPNIAEDVETGSHRLATCTNFTKTFTQARKYVVDNSKPRTDLEYDPLSNFSADLRSYSSVGKEQKNLQDLKRARKTAPCDQTKPAPYQPQLSQSPPPDPFDDSNEDDVLIIDIPPSADKKRGPDQKSVHSVSGRSLQDKVEELKVKKAPILLDSLPLSLANTESTSPLVLTREDNTIVKNCSTKNSQGPSDRYEKKESQNIPFDGSVTDLTKCSGDPGRKRQKTSVERSPEAASPLCTTDKQDKNCNGLVDKKETTIKTESPQCELPNRSDKMNPQDPYHFPSKNSLFYKPPEADSDSSYRQHIKQVLTRELPALWSSTKSVPSVLPHSQKTSQKMPGLMLGKATDDCASPKNTLNPASGSCHGQAEHNLSPSKLAKRAEPSSASTEKHMEITGNEAAIIIDSSSDDEDELNYLEMEMSDSDPMEECYRIFMEANNEEKSNASVAAMDEKKTKSNVKPQAEIGNKRVAHEAKHTEPGAKSRPEPKVLVPLRGPAVSGFASIPSKIQQVQQRASMLTASVQSGQAFVASTCQRRPESQSASAQTTEKPQPASVTRAYLNYISLGTPVFEVGNNLQLILPQGVFPLPVASTCSQLSTVLTPISQVRPNPVADRQTHHPAAVTPQRYHATAPVLIPAQARKPSVASASTHSSPAMSAAPQAVGNTTVKLGSTKRKLKQVSEDKVPHDVRQRYVNMFTEEFLKTTANVNDAFEKALAEERTVYNRSVNKLKYLSVAVNALKRLKSQNAVAVKDKNVVSSQRLKGSIPLNMENIKGNADDLALYESLTDYILTEEKLIEGNYPVKHPEKRGCAVLFEDNKKGPADPLKRICCRCGATYSVGQTGKHIRKEECNYHYGKVVRSRVPGGMETRYSCCEGVMGAPGCQVYKLHVHDSLSMDGFVSTLYGYSSDTGCPGVYSIDCEMCYTINGLELSRVTLVNSSLEVIYDTFVRPDHEVIDYNTRFSGISEEDVRGNRTSLKEVQAMLLSLISADTILIGHGLERDLCALKLLHGKVVDISVVFPHRLGPPHKRTLNNLTAEYLMRIIQESVCGHDTAEDATACMELILWRVKEDGKLKK